MTDKSNDAVAMWQNMMSQMEKGFSSFASQAMAAPEFNDAVNQVKGAAAGSQGHLGDLMEKYLIGMNLPSRTQMVSIDERLRSIEGQLSEIKTLLQRSAAESGPGAAPRPPRTRRPPASGDEPK